MISKSNVKCTDSNVKFADSEVRMASRFASSTQQEIEKLLEDKDSENTKRSTKVANVLRIPYKREKYPGATRQKGVSPSVETSVSVISLSLRLGLITLTSTLIIFQVSRFILVGYIPRYLGTAVVFYSDDRKH